jgi:hypothetical protein
MRVRRGAFVTDVTPQGENMETSTEWLAGRVVAGSRPRALTAGDEQEPRARVKELEAKLGAKPELLR